MNCVVQWQWGVACNQQQASHVFCCVHAGVGSSRDRAWCGLLRRRPLIWFCFTSATHLCANIFNWVFNTVHSHSQGKHNRGERIESDWVTNWVLYLFHFMPVDPFKCYTSVPQKYQITYFSYRAPCGFAQLHSNSFTFIMFLMWCCCSSNLSGTYCKCHYLSALLSWPPVILGRHSASLSAYRRLRWRFDGDKKCGLNKPDIVYFLCEMMWQLARWVFVICSMTAAFLATKYPLFQKSNFQFRASASADFALFVWVMLVC